MFSSPALLLLTLLTAISLSVQYDYCKLNKPFGKQIMCKYPDCGDLTSECRSEKRGIKKPCTQPQIDGMLETFNTMRLKMALGMETRGPSGPQPGSGNMNRVTWDSELATLAQCLANRCIFEHDDNRNVERFSYCGQNIFLEPGYCSDPNCVLNWTRAFEGWYNEVDTASVKLDITQSERQFEPDKLYYGHFNQLSWAQTPVFGCGGSTYFFEQKKKFVSLYVCNFAYGNYLSGPMYKLGAPCSKCDKDRSECTGTNTISTKGLCTAPSTGVDTPIPPIDNQPKKTEPTIVKSDTSTSTGIGKPQAPILTEKPEPNVKDNPAPTSSTDFCKLDRTHTMCKYPDCGVVEATCRKDKQGVSKPATNPEAQEMEDYANGKRLKVALGKEPKGDPGPQPQAANMNRVQWDPELAKIAQCFANQCLFNFDQKRNVERFPLVGQNIFMDYEDTPTNRPNWTKAVDFWYNAVDKVSSSTDITAFQPSRLAITGRYTQLLWAETTHFGCGASSFIFENSRKVTFIVCNYAFGNYPGASTYKIGSPCSKCDKDRSECTGTKEFTETGLCTAPTKTRHFMEY